ncbi:hypothetical protein D3C81_1869260 [compost metagenome]
MVMHKHLNHIRNNIAKQEGDDDQGNDHKHQRIDHRQTNALTRQLLGLGMLGQVIEGLFQIAGALGSRYRGAIHCREGLGVCGQCCSQGVAFGNTTGNVQHQLSDPALLVL